MLRCVNFYNFQKTWTRQNKFLIYISPLKKTFLKHKIFNLSKTQYPESKIFGLTTGLAVMKINSELGYEPVTYSELTQDEAFWSGCKSCVNFDILMSKERKNCMCTAMLYDPKDHYEPEETKQFFDENSKGLERLFRIRQWKLLKPFLKNV